ncbi:MAG: glycerol-3-phosphate 1-O-acyltransferase PlsY [Terriglobales bacterium]|jgi:acyl phosphate:glycerol-3-phosphate acyltransferase
MAQFLTVAALSYLLGSIPFGLILTRLFLGTDIREIGSGNIGATNVMRTGSKGLGVTTLLLDAAKGSAAVLLARHFTHSPELASLAAICAILGHVFPVWLKFKGGKGVATGVGSFLALAPKAVLIVLVIFVGLVAVFRYVSLGSIVAAAAFPVIASLFLYHKDPLALPFMYGAAIVIIAKHHTNIRRLLSGTEHRLEFYKR